MKIAIIGLGKTGSVVAEVAQARGHSIITIDPQHPKAHAKDLLSADIQACDICIDFSHPAAVLHNISAISELKKPIVVGTTGWYDQLNQVRLLIERQQTGFIYASNFSLGVMIFNQILSSTAKIMNKFENYDVAGIETHHNQKADSPSGTALTLAEILLENIDRKSKITTYLDNRKIAEDELLFSSLRCGSVPGRHEIIFDSIADSISLTHSARNRTGFALGAVMAAEWLDGKVGFFTGQDFFNDLLKEQL